MIRCMSLVAASVLSLAACSPEPQPAGKPAAPAEQTIETPADPAGSTEVPTAATPDSQMVLTADGIGPLTIGMDRADIVEMMGGPETPVAAPGAEPSACEVFHPAEAPDGVYVLLEEGVLASIYLTDQSSVTTDKGLKVGDTPDAVKAVYGDRVVETPSKYLEAPAGELTVWKDGNTSEAWVDDPAARGLQFSVGADSLIHEIKAGGPAIQLVEGCS